MQIASAIQGGKSNKRTGNTRTKEGIHTSLTRQTTVRHIKQKPRMV